MPSRKSGLKRIRSDERKRARNSRVKSEIRTLVNKFDLLVKDGNLEEAGKLLPSISSALDKASKRRIIPTPTANRKKSRLNKSLNAKS